MRLIFAFILLLCVPLALVAQDTKAVEIKKVTIQQSPIDDGKQMFNQYCSPCHGTNATGIGPATPALKKAAPDLTLIARRNGGKFPELKIMHILKEPIEERSHVSERPNWGPLFRSLDKTNDGAVQLRIYNLTKYLGSLQVK